MGPHTSLWVVEKPSTNKSSVDGFFDGSLAFVGPMWCPCGAHVDGPMLGHFRARLFRSHVKQFMYDKCSMTFLSDL